MGKDNSEIEPICNVTQFIVSDDKDQSTSLTVRVRSTWFHIFTTHDFLSSESNNSDFADEYVELRSSLLEKQSEPEGGKDNPDLTDSKSNSEDEDEDEAQDEDEDENKEQEAQEEQTTTTEQDLQNWLLATFGPVFVDKAPNQPKTQTIFDWYESPLFVYYLIAGKSGQLEPVLEDDEDKIHAVRLSLCPRCVLPKTDRSLKGVEWYSPKDLVVLDESAEPEPYHPSRVKYMPQSNHEEKVRDAKKEAEYFLKMHIPQQDYTTKREIRHLHEIQKIGLEDRGVSIPQLRGYVSHVRNPSSRAQILGFLIDPIVSPTPLTYMMDSSVDARKREKWAQESENMVRQLHDAGIVWGDAKGDNFVVDKDEKLWMIDFGGGYTEGWVEHELMETVDGDEMGTRMLVEGLRDPDGQPASGATTPESQPASAQGTKSAMRQADKRKERSSKEDLSSGKDAKKARVH